MRKFKLCMIGTLAVGKTSLIRRFVESAFSDKYLTTIGVKVEKKTLNVNGERADLMLWDIEGPDSFKQLQTSYLRGTSAYFIVSDLTRPATLETGLELQRKVENAIGPRPWTLVLNKADLVDQLDPGLVRPILESLSAVPVFRTSALTGENVEALFEHTSKRLLEQRGKASA